MDYNKKAIELTQRFIRIKSLSGNEKEIVAEVDAAFKELGFDEVRIDDYGSIVGSIYGKNSGKKLLLDAHIDTVDVPEPDKWTQDPFGGEIVGGKLYGRGATDMKGALAAMICGAASFAQEIDKDFSGEIHVSGVVHEECFEGIAAGNVAAMINPDFVVIGEASELNLKVGQRGRAEIVFEVYGKPAHSANPSKGINAVYKAAELIERVRELKMPYDGKLGWGILELVDIKSSPYPGASVVPDYCRITYDRRLLVGETRESVLKPLKDLLDEMSLQDKEFSAEVSLARGIEKCWTGKDITGERFFPGWNFEEREGYVQKALTGLFEEGLNPKIAQYSFCTNGSFYAGEAGIKTIGFGPSVEGLAHTIDEYINLGQIEKAVRGYRGICRSLLQV
jgi:putative selenium metabolism hydrolase